MSAFFVILFLKILSDILMFFRRTVIKKQPVHQMYGPFL